MRKNYQKKVKKQAVYPPSKDEGFLETVLAHNFFCSHTLTVRWIPFQGIGLGSIPGGSANTNSIY